MSSATNSVASGGTSLIGACGDTAKPPPLNFIATSVLHMRPYMEDSQAEKENNVKNVMRKLKVAGITDETTTKETNGVSQPTKDVHPSSDSNEQSRKEAEKTDLTLRDNTDESQDTDKFPPGDDSSSTIVATTLTSALGDASSMSTDHHYFVPARPSLVDTGGLFDMAHFWSSMQKHPLQSAWTMWYLRSDRDKEWEECLKEVSTFDTVEDWWALYNHIQEPSSLSPSSDYYIFKKGIKPMWEDEMNVKGGRWVFCIDRALRDNLLDHFWLELTMGMIGEQFGGYGELICGCVVNVRPRGDKLSLWTRDALLDTENRKIGEIMKQKLNIKDVIRFEVHTDLQVRKSSHVRPRITV